MDFGDLASTAAHDTASAIAMTAHPSSSHAQYQHISQANGQQHHTDQIAHRFHRLQHAGKTRRVIGDVILASSDFFRLGHCGGEGLRTIRKAPDRADPFLSSQRGNHLGTRIDKILRCVRWHRALCLYIAREDSGHANGGIAVFLTEPEC